MDIERVKNVVRQMTLEEKVALTDIGEDLLTRALLRLKVPSLKLPREFSLAAAGSDFDFPSFSALAHTFDPVLIGAFAGLRDRAAVTGGESYGGIVPLAVVRKPFDRGMSDGFSDDPLITEKAAQAYIDGSALAPVAVGLLGTSGFDRYIDADALENVYLRPFKTLKNKISAVALPQGRLCGIPVSENRAFMQTVTDGFDGLIFTQAGACVDKAEEVSSGACLDILPARIDGQRLLSAVSSGLLYEPKLDRAVLRNVFAAAKCYETVRSVRAPSISAAELDGLYLRASLESAVLLKNDGVLPLSERKTVCFGTQVNGCAFCGQPDLKKPQRSAQKAEGADLAAVFIEDAQDVDADELKRFVSLLKEKCKVILVLSASRYFEIRCLDDVSALIYMPYFSARGKEALSALLTGESDFTGRLTCAWAKRESDYPYAALGFGGRDCYVGESGLIGNRYFSLFKSGLMFKCGHGLRYAEAEVSGLKASVKDGKLTVKFRAKTESKFRTGTVTLSVRADGLGVGERMAETANLTLSATENEYEMTADLERCLSAESIPGGEYTACVDFGNSFEETTFKIKGVKIGGRRRAADGTGGFDLAAAEKAIGFPSNAADFMPDEKEAAKAKKKAAAYLKKKTAKKSVRRQKSALEGLTRFDPNALIKAVKALKEK